MPFANSITQYVPEGRKSFGLTLAVSLAVLSATAGCRDAAAEVCPPLLSQVESRLTDQGLDRGSEKFRSQLARATRTCQDDPEAFGALLARTGP